MLALLSLLAFAATARSRVDDDTSKELLYDSGRSQIGVWIAHDDGLIGSSHRGGGNGWGTNLAPGTLTDNPPSKDKNRAYCYAQPVSHFDASAPQTKFCQRYWVNADYYKPGGPVFVFDAGEGPGDYFLSSGSVVWQWAQRFNGVFIVLEHRYYGWSVPVPDFTTDNLRFLNNKEALQDSADFIKYWQPPADLRAKMNISGTLHPNKTPWIYYGGSYPGGRASHMRVLYPDLVFGAIASSGVTYATTDLWSYFDAPIKYGPKDCIAAMQEAIKAIDHILDQPAPAGKELKKLFGAEALEDDDFGALLRSPAWSWQARGSVDNHDNKFIYKFCPTLTQPGTKPTILNGITVPASVVNYANWTRTNEAAQCANHMEVCYGTHNMTVFQDRTAVDQTWRLWTWQVCTTWGYGMPAPPPGRPSIISKRVTAEYEHRICTQAYAPGKVYQVPAVPDVDEVNRLGGLSISADRLAIISGDGDPWLSATGNAGPEYGGPLRVNSVQQPVYTIPNSGHVPDLAFKSNEAANLKAAHDFEFHFIGEWLKQFKPKN